MASATDYLTSLARSGVDTSQVNPVFAARMQNLISAAEAATGGTVQLTSGYRSPEHQAQIYANYTKQPVSYGGKVYAPNGRSGIAAPPGRSEHQLGTAIDIAPTGAAYQWMVQHASDYGVEAGAYWKGSQHDPPHFQIPRSELPAVLKGNVPVPPPANVPSAPIPATMPAGLRDSGVTEAQRNAILAVPSAPPKPLPTISNGQQASDFYSGFGLVPSSPPPSLPSIPPSLIGNTFASLDPAQGGIPPGFNPGAADRMVSNTFASLNAPGEITPKQGSPLYLPPPMTAYPNIANGQVTPPALPQPPSSILPMTAPPPIRGEDITPTASAAPTPMDRLRVTPNEILAGLKQFASGSNVNLDAIPPEQQQALAQALPVLMGMPDGQDGDIARLKYLQANNLLDPLLKVVPTQSIDPITRTFGGMKYGVTIPPNVPADISQWGLRGNLGDIASLTDPNIYRRPISSADGVTSSPAPANGGWPTLTPPSSPPPLPTSNNGGWGNYMTSTPPPAVTNPLPSLPAAAPATKTVTQQVLNPAYTKWASLAGPADPYQNSAFNYAMQQAAGPAPPKYISVKTQAPVPHVPVPGVAAPIPLSPPQDELAQLRLQAQNPLQRAFGMTPLGHITNFAGNLGQANHYGAPTTPGLLGMLGGFLGGLPHSSPTQTQALAPMPSYSQQSGGMTPVQQLQSQGMSPSQAYNTLAAGILATGPDPYKNGGRA